jgi:hypothetical protein
MQALEKNRHGLQRNLTDSQNAIRYPFLSVYPPLSIRVEFTLFTELESAADMLEQELLQLQEEEMLPEIDEIGYIASTME